MTNAPPSAGSRVSAADIRAVAPDDDYLAYHAPRYAYVLGLLSDLRVAPSTRVCDIGRSRLTDLIAQRFGVRVDSLGFGPDAETPTGRHHQFDLNASQDEARWRRGLPQFDVIVFAEVIEHLPTSPARVLRFLRTLLAERGLLVIQTPNAAALHKRVQLLLGRNPYELIREDATNPGHFREYTLDELRAYVREAGFTVERAVAGRYFDYRYRGHCRGHRVRPRLSSKVINAVYAVCPGSLKPGITMVVRKDG